MNDPRPQNPYGKLYTVDFLGNMVKARCTLYNNQPIQLLKNVAAESIKKGEVGGSEEQVRPLVSVRSSEKVSSFPLRPCGSAVTSRNTSTANWASMT